MIYIREAHPTDGWQVASNREQQVLFAQPTTAQQRADVANVCAANLRLSLPTVVDSLDNQADIAFNAWPERLYVLSSEGRVVYQGGKGPYGFDPEELSAFLHSYC